MWQHGCVLVAVIAAMLIENGPSGAEGTKIPAVLQPETRLDVSTDEINEMYFSLTGKTSPLPTDSATKLGEQPMTVLLHQATRVESVVPCFFLCLLLCLSCCCFSGLGGFPGLICGTLFPLGLFLYVALGTSILTDMVDGLPVGFWCAVLGVWVMIALFCGVCLLSLGCCGIIGLSGASAYMYFALTGQQAPWGWKDDVERGVPYAGTVQGFPAAPPDTIPFPSAK